MKPTIRRFAYLVLIIFICIYGIVIYLHWDTAITQDLGRHFALGRLILGTGKIPNTNLFSYTNPNFVFINHHWGSEILFYLLHQTIGINGLILFTVTICMMAFLPLVIYSYFKTHDINALLISSIVALELLRERTEIRPEIFGYLGFSFFLLILYKEIYKESKLIFTLPFILLLWVNSHISFVFGVVIFCLFFVDRIILKKNVRKYIFIGILLTLVVFLNPFGVEGALYPLKIFSNYGYSIVENQKPLFLETVMRNQTIFYLKVAYGLTILLSFFILKKRSYFALLVLLFFDSISYFAIRHFPFLALSIVYPFAIGISNLNVYVRKFIDKKIRLLSESVFYFCGITFITFRIFSLVTNGYYSEINSLSRFGFGEVIGMKNTMDYFISHQLEGPVFNNFDIGSYLIYRLYPKEKVFVDGRPEAYPTDFFQKVYIPMQENNLVWSHYLDVYNIRSIVFGHTDGTPWAIEFLRRIVNDPGWKLVYFDASGVIFIRHDSIQNGVNVLDTDDKLISFTSSLLKSYSTKSELIRLFRFFSIIQHPGLKTMTAEKIYAFK